MLNLKSDTPPSWFAQVKDNLDELLIDHAHCEKKAAGTAMNLIFYYVEHVDLCRELSAIVVEELEHFSMVLDLLAARNISFRRTRPSQYGSRLHELIRKQEPGRAIDRLLIAGIIEARSCERFSVLRDHIEDPELATFFGSLFESEARHHSTYVNLANLFGPNEDIQTRLHELAEKEAEIISEGDDFPRIHS